jgi:signal transduction histidine kinase
VSTNIKQSILLIAGIPDRLSQLKELLEYELPEYGCLCVTDAETALQRALQHVPIGIIWDHPSGVDTTFLDSLRSHEQTSDIPVLLILPEQEAAALLTATTAYGVWGTLSVSVDKSEILHELSRMLNTTASDVTSVHKLEMQLERERNRNEIILRYQYLMAGVTSILTGDSSLDKGVQTALRSIVETIGIQYAGVFQLERESGAFTPLSTFVDTQAESGNLFREISDDVLPELKSQLAQGLVITIENSDSLAAAEKALYAQVGISSLLGIPVLVQGELRLVVMLMDSKSREWDADLVTCLRSISNIILNTWDRYNEFQGRLKAEQQRTEAVQLAERTSRLASLGTLVAGISHEINQPLNATMITVDGMLYWERRNKQIPHETYVNNLRLLAEQAERIDSIIRNKRQLVGEEETKPPGATDLNLAVQHALVLVGQRLQNYGIQLELQLEEPATMVLGHVSHLQQVVLNLVTNAMRVLEHAEQESKNIIIRTSIRNSYGVLDILDNGPGLSPDAISRIFDPFFTEGEQAGMGLGLSITQNIVDSYRGQITASNRSERGAHFCVELPLQNASEKDSA